MNQYWVYIMTNRSKTLHVGVTHNLEKRAREHPERSEASRSFGPAGLRMTVKEFLEMTVFSLCLVLLCLVPLTHAAEDSLDTSTASELETEVRDPIVLKMMIVNPSDKYKQTYPLKSYLPEEVEPRHILNKDDLEIGYDAQKKSYYTMKDIELEPGQSVVKSIEIEDIWFIAESQMKDYAFEARELFSKVKKTKFEDRARLLLNNIEVLLTQVYERQNDDTVTPEEHISIYRDNVQKLRDIELDLVALRRLVVGAAGEAGLFNKAEGSTSGFMDTTWDAELAEKAKGSGSVPAWVAWRVIFGIIFFLGILTLGFYWTWQVQLRKIEKLRKPKKGGDEAFNLDEVFGGAGAASKPPDEGADVDVSIKTPGKRPYFPPSVPEEPKHPDDRAA